MSGLTRVGVDIVAQGVEAFRNAGKITADTIVQINQNLRSVPDASSVAVAGIDAVQKKLEEVQKFQKTQQAILVSTVKAGGIADKEDVTRLAQANQAVSILTRQLKELQQEEIQANSAAGQLGERFSGSGREARNSLLQVQGRIRELKDQLKDLRGQQAQNILEFGKPNPELQKEIGNI